MQSNPSAFVLSQVEELNSELDLRLHLHEPRAARAEQDVHNVRAGRDTVIPMRVLFFKCG